jgi:hypothetical protein
VLQECFAPFNHGHSYEVMTPVQLPTRSTSCSGKAFDLILLDNVLPGTGAQVPFKQRLDLRSVMRRDRTMLVG